MAPARDAAMVREGEYTAPPRVADAISALGRTEDVRFSPSSRRLAIAAFQRNRIVVFDIDITAGHATTRVALTGGVELSSPALVRPHGVDFLDEDTLIVTSRGSDVALFKVPAGGRDLRHHEALPLARWPADGSTLLNAPGSVAVTRTAEGECEVLICNNNAHTVTRHRLDRDAVGLIRRSEILLQKHLDIPDGVTVSPDRRWLAVSNHTTHNVLLYESSAALSADAEPVGILRRVYYPHGLRFSADGGHLFVADAGAPYLHIYAQHPDGWRGVRDPVATVRIMDDATFRRGRHNPQEGGPKGLDIDGCSRVLVVTSECQPLAFFDVPELVQRALAGDSAREGTTLGITYELSLMQENHRKLAGKALEVSALRNSLSWRITAPLRRVRSAFRRRGSHPGQSDPRIPL
jgi:DNA-binding beta-propeller fold protein YncE